jgi:hypothetical protein
LTLTVAVLVRSHMSQAAPPGIEPKDFLLAVAEDTY